MATQVNITLPDGSIITKTATGVITNWFFRYILSSYPGKAALRTGNVKIVFSSAQIDENEFTQKLTNIVAVASMIPVDNINNNGSRWVSDTEPPYILLKGTIPEPSGGARTFGTVGICIGINNPGNYENITASVIAYTKLDPPIEQIEQQFIPIDYRIYFEDRQWFNFINPKEARNEFAENMLLGNSNWNNYTDLYCCFQKPTRLDYKALLPVNDLRFAIWTDSGSNWSSAYNLTSSDYTYNYSLYKYKQGIDRDENWFVGRIFSFLLLGSNLPKNAAFSFDFFKNPNEPFQTAFWHSDISTQPFFNPQTIGSSSGVITIDHLSESNKWNKVYPDLYKIQITKSGAVGTAEYNIQRRCHFGFEDNSYTDRWGHIPWLNWMRQPHPDFYGWQNWADIIYISESKVLRYDSTGITVVDLFSGEFTSWFGSEQLSSNDSRKLLINVYQVSVNSNRQKFTVACKAAALTFDVDNQQNGITEIADIIYGVSYGLNDDLYILTDGTDLSDHDGIFLKKKASNNILENIQLQDSDLPLTVKFRFTKFIKASKIKNELVFIVQHETDSNNFHIVWCSTTGLVSYGGTSSYISAHPGCIEANQKGDWFINRHKLAFASSNRTYTPGTINSPGLTTNDILCPYSGRTHYKITFYENDLIQTNRLISCDNNQVLTTYVGLIDESFYVHLGRGVVVSSKGYIRQLFSNPSDNNYFWESYGWNGSIWVKNNPNSKITKDFPEALMDNLSIKFEGSEVSSFVEKEYLTQTICWGLLKDNVTTQFKYNIEWWSRNITEEIYSSNIPPQNELSLKDTLTSEKKLSFLNIEWDMLHKWEVTIDNIPVTLEPIHINTVPNPGEIEIVKSQIPLAIDSYNNNEIYYSDTIRFNSNDSGKPFTIKYYWVGR